MPPSKLRPLAAVALLGACAPTEPPRTAAPPLASASSAPSAPAPVSASASAPRPPSSFVAAFSDPDRRRRLEAAFPQIDALVENELREEKLPSVTVGIVLDGELAYAKGFGLADVATGRKADADTVYRVASISKSFTALTVLRLRDEGKLSLDDALAKHLPEMASVEAFSGDAPPLTLRHVLTHTSGLPRDGSYPTATKEATDADILRVLSSARLEAAPGARFAYSNLAYAGLGVAAGRAAGTGFRRAVADRIFAPLGMTASTFDVDAVPAARLATAYKLASGGLVPIDPWTFRAGDGAGGLYTSLRDLARFATLQLAAYPARGGADEGPVRRATIREAHEPRTQALPLRVALRENPEPGQRPVSARVASYGYGWFEEQICDFDDLVFHGGIVDGYTSMLALLPERGVAAIVLANARHADSEWLAKDALIALRRTGALVKRSADPRLAARFEPAVEAIAKLVGRYDAATYDAMLSEGRPRLPAEKDELEGYGARHGACKTWKPVEIASASQATFDLACEKGRLELSLTLGADGKVTGFDGLSRGLDAPPKLREAAEKVVALVAKWDEKLYERHLAKHTKDKAKLVAKLDRIRRAHGACALREVEKAGTEDRFVLGCEKHGALVLRVTLDPRSEERIKAFQLTPQTAGACPSF